MSSNLFNAFMRNNSKNLDENTNAIDNHTLDKRSQNFSSKTRKSKQKTYNNNNNENDGNSESTEENFPRREMYDNKRQLKFAKQIDRIDGTSFDFLNGNEIMAYLPQTDDDDLDYSSCDELEILEQEEQEQEQKKKRKKRNSYDDSEYGGSSSNNNNDDDDDENDNDEIDKLFGISNNNNNIDNNNNNLKSQIPLKRSNYSIFNEEVGEEDNNNDDDHWGLDNSKSEKQTQRQQTNFKNNNNNNNNSNNHEGENESEEEEQQQRQQQQLEDEEDIIRNLPESRDLRKIEQARKIYDLHNDINHKNKKKNKKFCFGCMWQDPHKVSISGDAVSIMMKTMYRYYGQIRTVELARIVHIQFMRDIYWPKKKELNSQFVILNNNNNNNYDNGNNNNNTMPIWRTYQIYDHLKNHVQDPRFFILNSIEELKTDSLNLKKMSYIYVRDDKTGNEYPSFDEKAIKLRLDINKRIWEIYSKLPKNMNFYNDQIPINLDKAGTTINLHKNYEYNQDL